MDMGRGQSCFLFPLVFGLCACSQPGVLVDIGTWPDQAASLSVDGALNGNPFTSPLSFPFGTTKFIVDLPEGKTGQLALRLAALDQFGCPRATAETQVEVAARLQPFVETAVTMTSRSRPYCPQPTLSGITPASGKNSASTPITLSGSGFLSGARVTVGGEECTNVNVVSPTQLTCSAETKSVRCGPQEVIITNPDNQTAMGNLFSYRPFRVVFGTTTTLTTTSMEPLVLVAADFNEDGKLDLASANRGTNNVSIYLNNGSGVFAAATNYAAGMAPESLTVVDLDKDNNLDLVTADAGSGTISFLAGNGGGGFVAPVSKTGAFANPSVVAAGDFNKDGNPDLAVTNTFSSNLVIFTGDGAGGLSMGTPVTVGINARYLALADLNKDGNLDVVTPNVSSNNISYRPGNGNATFGAGTDIPIGAVPVAVAVADVNGDQNPDILATSESSSMIYVYLGNGAGAFNAADGSPFATGGATPQILKVVDMDGDGNLDIVVANYGGNSVSIFAGNGMGAFSVVSGSPFAAPGNPWGVVADDFNGDGLIDVATTNRIANNTAVRLATCN